MQNPLAPAAVADAVGVPLSQVCVCVCWGRGGAIKRAVCVVGEWGGVDFKLQGVAWICGSMGGAEPSGSSRCCWHTLKRGGFLFGGGGVFAVRGEGGTLTHSIHHWILCACFFEWRNALATAVAKVSPAGLACGAVGGA